MAISIKENPSCYASLHQKEVLSSLAGLDVVSEHFFLTGGTALAVFYLHHRSSEDIDLFSVDFDDLSRVDLFLKRTFSEEVNLVQSSPHFFSYLIKGVRVELVYDSLSIRGARPLVELQMGGSVRVDSLENIASNKLAAMTSRYEPKDLIDFYFLSEALWKGSEERHFLDCYEAARKKEVLLDDPAMAAYQVEELLKMVLAKKEAAVPMLQPVDWTSLENTLGFFVKTMYGMEKW